jgi:phage host-nuclease inhibitor protein Gam
MATKPRAKGPAATFVVPQSRAEATEAVARIGVKSRELQRIEADMNDKMAKIRQTHEERAKPLRDEIEADRKGVQVWCEANRAALTDGGKTKTVNLAAGEVKWRLTPPAVKIARGMLESVMSAIRAAGLSDQLIRVKEELNKEAVLAVPERIDGIKGISIEQAEEFIVEPFADELTSA